MHMATYGRTIARLQTVILPVFEALEAGLQAAAEQHASQGYRRGDDPWYYGHTARRVAIERLSTYGLQALDEAGRRIYPMSGLLLFHQDFAVRVLRARTSKRGRREIPVPGRSAARQRFWRQEGGSALPGMTTDNLLLLWTDTDGILDEPLLLVRPVGGDQRRSSLKLDWVGPLDRSMAARRVEDLNELVPDVAYPRLGEDGAG